MKRTLFALLVLSFSLLSDDCQAQDKNNQTDSLGQKQGHWIAKYENGNPKYDGYFVNDNPSGEFKRYYDNGEVSAIMNYVADTDSVYALFYHSSGFESSRGWYVKQSKEGEWKYFSQYLEDYMVCCENYSGNLKEGISRKYHWNGNMAEEVRYISDKREGIWIQNYSDGILGLRANYVDGKLNGSFEAFTIDGKPMIVGVYRNDIRAGEWVFYNNEGILYSRITYINGIPENNLDIIKSATDLLDELEKKGGVIEDPAKTGIIW